MGNHTAFYHSVDPLCSDVYRQLQAYSTALLLTLVIMEKCNHTAVQSVSLPPSQPVYPPVSDGAIHPPLPTHRAWRAPVLTPPAYGAIVDRDVLLCRGPFHTKTMTSENCTVKSETCQQPHTGHVCLAGMLYVGTWGVTHMLGAVN